MLEPMAIVANAIRRTTILPAERKKWMPGYRPKLEAVLMCILSVWVRMKQYPALLIILLLAEALSLWEIRILIFHLTKRCTGRFFAISSESQEHGIHHLPMKKMTTGIMSLTGFPTTA